MLRAPVETPFFFFFFYISGGGVGPGWSRLGGAFCAAGVYVNEASTLSAIAVKVTGDSQLKLHAELCKKKKRRKKNLLFARLLCTAGVG